MNSFLNILLMCVSVALIILSLLQSGKSDGINSAFTGGDGLNLFANVKERGPEKVISNLTLVMGISFFVIVIIVSIIG
ncbi:MAG: preprotein translocase subunit SecG [Erysipelotrichaceae bacterium]